MSNILRVASCFLPLALTTGTLSAQCPAGELEVTIDVITDDYGNETYWELVPFGNTCGQSPIYTGGNPALNCASSAGQTSPAGGYANNATIPTGPWCLTEGAQYNIVSVDSWGDGHASFQVFVNGGSVGLFTHSGAMGVHTFTVAEPVALDLSVTMLTTSLFSDVDQPVVINGRITNMGGLPVTSFTLNYSIDGGTPVTEDITGVNLTSGAQYEFTSTTPWTPVVEGPAVLEVWATNLNGQPDLAPANDVGTANLMVNPAIPDIIADYLLGQPIFTTVADDDEDLLVPRDLDFHPDRNRNELWVINKDVENSGGSTVKFTDPGGPSQTQLWQRDPNAWHFMSLPTGIAFGDNGNFSTCPGVFDANHNGGTPFTGPSLWSSDPAIYAATIFGGLGSHLDMLHVTPNSQGIAHERWNRFWVVDGFNHDVVMHDFRADHGPGQDYHGDALIRRYAGIDLSKDPNDHVVSHCVVDKTSGWLYVADFGNARVVRLDTRSGSVSGPGTYGPWENYVEYSQMSGHTWETVTTTGLVQPSGIEVIGDHLLVSDHSTGDIVVYNIAVPGMPEIGRIETGLAGIMGIKVGPDGSIWYVNATTHALVRIDVDQTVGVEERTASSMSVYPNPANDRVFLTHAASLKASTDVHVVDNTGRTVIRTTAMALRSGIDVSSLAPGSYALLVADQPALRMVITR